MTQDHAKIASKLIIKIQLLQQSIDNRFIKMNIKPNLASPEYLDNEIEEYKSRAEDLWIEFANEKIKLLNAELEAL